MVSIMDELMDELNNKILDQIGHDALQSSNVLGKKLNVRSATIRRRLKWLLQNKVMRIVAVVHPKRVGLDVAAVIGLDIDHDTLDSALEVLSNQPEIKWVATVTGRFDILALGRFRSNDDLSDFLKKYCPR